MRFFATAFSLSLLLVNTACQNSTIESGLADGSEKTSRKGVVTITTTVSQREELPVCNSSSEGLSGYVAPADRFVKCQAGRWKNVTPGSVASRFAPRSHVRFNEWQDQTTKTRWSLPLEREVAAADAPLSCSKGWKLPSREQLLNASNNGLIEGLRSRGGRAFEKAWTAEFEVVNGVSQRASFNLSSAKGTSAGEAGIYCINSTGNS